MSSCVHLVDDNVQFLESAAWWLESLGYQVRTWSDPVQFLNRVPQLMRDVGPSCLVMDIRMPEMTGLQVHDELKQRGVGWPLIYMTGHGDVPLAVEAMEKGALTFLEKPFKERALERALERAFEQARRALSTGSAEPSSLEPPRATVVAAAPSPGQIEFRRRIELLTAREREVLQWVVDGRLNKGIADKLGISVKTVELHRSRVMSKMQARSITELMKFVISGEAN